jgi:4'-phosphopantetheinyl transferase
MLSRDELRRAERWRFEQDRDRFIIGRALLRTILGRYVGVSPNRLQFRSGPNGKPALTQQSGGDRFHFNISHSQGLVLYAVTHHQEIGVDVERIRSIPEADQIAAHFFSPREYAEFRAVPTKLKCDAFFNCWTRKEAVVKATGNGLAWPLDRFEVSLTPGQPAQLVSVSGDATEASRWSLKTLIPAPGYTAALAVPIASCGLACWQLPPTEPQEEERIPFRSRNIASPGTSSHLPTGRLK